MSRRLKLVLAGVLALLVVTGTLGYLLYPKLAFWALRTRVLPRVEARLGPPLRIGHVEIDWGRARL